MSLRLKVRGSLFFFGLLAPVTAFLALLGPSEYVELVQEGASSWWAMVAPLGFCLLLIVEVWVLRWAVMKARGDLLRHVPTIILVFSGLFSLIVASHKHDGAGFYTILAFLLFFMAWLVRRRKR